MYCKQYNKMIKTIYQTNPGVIYNVYVNMMKFQLLYIIIKCTTYLIKGSHSFSFAFLFKF